MRPFSFSRSAASSGSKILTPRFAAACISPAVNLTGSSSAASRDRIAPLRAIPNSDFNAAASRKRDGSPILLRASASSTSSAASSFLRKDKDFRAPDSRSRCRGSLSPPPDPGRCARTAARHAGPPSRRSALSARPAGYRFPIPPVRCLRRSSRARCRAARSAQWKDFSWRALRRATRPICRRPRSVHRTGCLA